MFYCVTSNQTFNNLAITRLCNPKIRGIFHFLTIGRTFCRHRNCFRFFSPISCRFREVAAAVCFQQMYYSIACLGTWLRPETMFIHVLQVSFLGAFCCLLSPATRLSDANTRICPLRREAPHIRFISLFPHALNFRVTRS